MQRPVQYIHMKIPPSRRNHHHDCACTHTNTNTNDPQSESFFVPDQMNRTEPNRDYRTKTKTKIHPDDHNNDITA
jgi:hypothetical protein